MKKNSAAVQKYLEALAAIEFPGSTAVKDAASSFGAGYVSGPVTFIFEKVCVFLPEEVKTREVPMEEVKAEEPAKTEEASGEKEKEIVEETKQEESTFTTTVVEEKKQEVVKEEEKTHVEEVKREEAAAPTLAPEVVGTPAKAPETTTTAPVAEPPKP